MSIDDIKNDCEDKLLSTISCLTVSDYKELANIILSNSHHFEKVIDNKEATEFIYFLSKLPDNKEKIIFELSKCSSSKAKQFLIVIINETSLKNNIDCTTIKSQNLIDFITCINSYIDINSLKYKLSDLIESYKGNNFLLFIQFNFNFILITIIILLLLFNWF